MRKIYIVAGIAGVVALGGVGTYAFINATQPKDIVVQEKVIITKNSVPTATPKPTATTPPTSAPVTEEPVTSEPSQVIVPQEPAAVVEQVQENIEYTPIDMATRQWTDGYGNQYVGPNAISCADGSAPITMGYGFPLQCALNLGNAELLE